jgi:formiminoglutamase
MTHFRFYKREDILFLTKVRRFETKIGERISVVADRDSWLESLQNHPARYVLFGIPEDLGVKANQGISGADTSWLSFLHAFLNLQSNDYFTGESLVLLGHFDFGDLKYLIESNAAHEEEKLDAYRHAVLTVDEEVEQLVKSVVAMGKIPIAIGGGQNNAYPLLKGTAKGLVKCGKLPIPQMNCINFDAHTDYRPLEGRHSGNGFRYADEDGYLQQYCVLGVQENFIPQNVLMDIAANPFMDFISWEDIFLYERKSFQQAVQHAIDFTSNTFTGLELDVDVIENVMSSAQMASGFSVTHARQYVNWVASESNLAYFHLSEAAQQMNDGRKSDTNGKLMSLLVSDFVKAHSRTHQPSISMIFSNSSS